MPLPCSPVSTSMSEDTSTSQSQSGADSDSEGDLITPRPGPSNPEQRTQAALSRPVKPTAEAFNRPNTFKEWRTGNIRERLELTDEEIILEQALESTTTPPIDFPRSDNKRAYSISSEGAQSGVSSHNRPAHTAPLQLSIITTVASTAPIDPTTSSLSSRSRSGSHNSQKLRDLKAKAKSSPTSSVSIAIKKPPEPERTRSVSFHPSSYTRPVLMEDTGAISSNAVSSASYTSASKASPRGLIHDSRHPVDEQESSADENTTIFRRTLPPAANYGTSRALFVPSNSDPHAEGYDGAGEEEPPVSSERTAKKPKPPNDNTSASDSDSSKDAESWWRRTLDKYGSIELENKGSVARDHLALERTFLAWLRTSLSFASIGIAVTQLFRLNTALQSSQQPAHVVSTSSDQEKVYTSEFLTALVTSPELRKLSSVGKPLGATFLGVAILILFVGFHRYFESQHYVIRGKFPASRGSIILVSAVAGALIVASLAVIVGIKPSAM